MQKLVVHQLLYHTLNIHPQQEIVSGSTRLTYEQFFRRVLRLANSLQELGVKKGTVVGVLDVNSHRYLELHYALSMLGAVNHTINFRLAPEAMAYTMTHAGDELLLVSDVFSQAAAPLAQKFPRWVLMSDDPEAPLPEVEEAHRYEELISSGEEKMVSGEEKVEETDTYSIFYTTGTTGNPKGIPYRHRDILLGAHQILHHLSMHTTGGNIHSSDVFMPLIPYFHIHAWGTAFYVPYLGAKLVLPGRSSAAEQVELIKKEGVTWLNMVPTQLHMLLEEEGFGNVKILTGGSPLPSGLAKRAAQAGVDFSLIYGGSDQLGTAISVVPEDKDPQSEEAHEILRANMRPLPMVEVSMVDESNQEVPRDGSSIGEVWVRSPWLPQGYYKDPERTQESYLNGWFKTGDLGVYYPDGSIYVADRISDAIKSGGEWIPTGVLETFISEHPVVEQVAVIAQKDERWGERPLAIVKASGSVSEEELKNFLGEKAQTGQMASYWIPDSFVFVDEIPITSAGKINKAQLRSHYAD